MAWKKIEESKAPEEISSRRGLLDTIEGSGSVVSQQSHLTVADVERILSETYEQDNSPVFYTSAAGMIEIELAMQQLMRE